MNARQIDKVDYITTCIYLLAGGFIWFAYELSILPQESINKLLLALTFAGPISLFLMYYKRLRVPIVSLLWLAVGILQWIILNKLKANPDFVSVRGSYADSEINLVAVVVVFNLARLLSLLITKQEFMVAAWFSPRDDRELNYLDYLLTFVGFIVLSAIIVAYNNP